MEILIVTLTIFHDIMVVELSRIYVVSMVNFFQLPSAIVFNKNEQIFLNFS